MVIKAYPVGMVRATDVNGMDETEFGFEPHVGLEFDSADDARELYSLYAKRMGFKIRTGQLYRSRTDGSVASRRFVCSKEGFQLNSRSGCPAFIRVQRRDTGKWVIDHFLKDHNHDLEHTDEKCPPFMLPKTPIVKNLMTDVAHKPKVKWLEEVEGGQPCTSGVIKRVKREGDGGRFQDDGGRFQDEPRVGLEFNSANEAHEFYHAYAANKGFRIRIGQLFRSKLDGSITSRRFVCSKEGYQHPSRVGCGARARGEAEMESQPQVVKKKETRGRKPKPKDDKKEESGKVKEAKKSQQPTVDDKYTQWKSLVPVLYDWLANHNLVWPSLSCRWGPQLEKATYKNRQRLYLSEQTDGSVPNTLVIANCEVVKPRVAAAEHISQFNEEARSPFVKKYKTIIHPGEVNRIRELPQNSKIVATHTDSPDVLIWDVEAQPNRHAVLGATNSRPDLILTGHQDNAEFALAMCPTEPYVLSGGKDKSVVLWSIQDHISATATSPGAGGSIIKPNSKPGEGNDKAADGPSVGPRGVYLGHEDTVEDVAFCPSSAQEFCSVGDDSCLILWDARVGSSPVVKVEKAHNADLHCVDWNPHDDNLILTGSADNSVRMFDRRNLTSNGVGSSIYKFEGHRAAVLCVQWSPDKSSVFGSSAEDGLLNIWDYAKVGKKVERAARSPSSPPGLFFQHAGHRDKVVDFHWNAFDPWTIVSVSDDCDSTGGGGTLQIWRMSDLIYRPEEEVLAELEKFKSHVVACASKPRES